MDRKKAIALASAVTMAIIAIVAVTWIQQQDAKEVTWDDLISIDKDAAETAMS